MQFTSVLVVLMVDDFESPAGDDDRPRRATP
jgi:hypothetical protein